MRALSKCAVGRLPRPLGARPPVAVAGGFPAARATRGGYPSRLVAYPIRARQGARPLRGGFAALASPHRVCSGVSLPPRRGRLLRGWGRAAIIGRAAQRPPHCGGLLRAAPYGRRRRSGRPHCGRPSPAAILRARPHPPFLAQVALSGNFPRNSILLENIETFFQKKRKNAAKSRSERLTTPSKCCTIVSEKGATKWQINFPMRGRNLKK